MIIIWPKFTVVLVANAYFCGSLNKIGEKLECLLSLIKLMSEAITFKSESKRNTCVSNCYGKNAKVIDYLATATYYVVVWQLYHLDYTSKILPCEHASSRNNWMHAYFTQFCFQFQFSLVFYTLSTVHFFIPIHSIHSIEWYLLS